MLRRLVDRFWTWENGLRDPDAETSCALCERRVRRRDAVGACCSEEHQDEWLLRSAW